MAYRITFLLLFALSDSLLAASLEGQVEKINDGDTFVIWGQSIRLKGIDAPEYSQECKDKNGTSYSCGDFASHYLRELIGNQNITCTGDQMDEYQRLLATCYADGININQQMVNAGWAVAFIKYDDIYVSEENAARRAKRGMWQGDFIRPTIFRSSEWDKAQSKIKQQGGECVIKGNINSKGQRIYHTPWGSKHYQQTRINTRKGERWFCTEAEALAAGWRAPYR